MKNKYEVIHWNLADHKQITLIDNENDMVIAHFYFDYSLNDFDKRLEIANNICNILNNNTEQ